MAVNPVPEGYHTVTPYLVLPRVAEFIDFVRQAFDATEVDRSERSDGTVMHAAVRIGDSNVMIGGSNDEYAPMPAMLYLYVPDVDATYAQALEAGATSLQEPADQFYGDRNGGVRDAWGNSWWIGTHVEDVAPDEMKRRAAEHNG